MNFYYMDQTGSSVGPVTREQLQKLVDDGLVAVGSQACYEGSEDWKPLSDYIRPTGKPDNPETRATAHQQPFAKLTTPQPEPVTPAPTASRAVVALLVALVVLTAINFCFHFDERLQRRQTVRAVTTASSLIEANRMEVFTDYAKNLDDYATKSIYHQIYHANNAQLQLLNLSVQEQQLIIQLLAGKK